MLLGMLPKMRSSCLAMVNPRDVSAIESPITISKN